MKSFIFLIAVVYCSNAFAQRPDGGKPTSSIISFSSMSVPNGTDPFVYGKATYINGSKYEDVSGSPFLNSDYTPAYITDKNGRGYSNMPIKFDMLDNEIDIQRGNQLMSLLNVDSVSYTNVQNQNVILKTGYPAINKHNVNSIYQVMAQNNKIQLLKYYYCYVENIKDYGLPDKAAYQVQNKYYFFNKATKTIEEIKLNEKSFLSGLADMGYSKAEIGQNKEVDFKNEKDVISLVNTMNN